MANALDVRVVEDGRRNAVVKIVGLADSSDIIAPAAIRLSQFTNNDVPATFNGLRFVEADFAVSNMFSVLLEWNGNTVQPMVSFADAGSFSGRRHGGFNPDRTVSGYDGNVNLRTRGFVGGNTYVFTMLLRFTKMYS